MRSFVICTLRQVCNQNDQIEEDEIGGACSTNEEVEERVLDDRKARGKETTRKTMT
jgi:hypothetical protein